MTRGCQPLEATVSRASYRNHQSAGFRHGVQGSAGHGRAWFRAMDLAPFFFCLLVAVCGCGLRGVLALTVAFRCFGSRSLDSFRL